MFPFDQPAPTAFYLVLYIGTLVLHVVPMNYVLAGSTWLAGLAVWQAAGGKPSEATNRIAAALRDWMPFALSVAISAGVAPLLFVQVLYKLPFYTANLLLFHRWMAILPVLIVAFYLLYLQKSIGFLKRPALLRAAITLGIWFCFGFVGWSWTENHLLSTRGQDAWVEQYAGRGLFYGDPELAPRLALWWIGAVPTLAMLLAWQGPIAASSEAAKTLARLALVGMPAAVVAGVVYYLAIPRLARTAVLDGWPYAVLATVGLAIQACGWWAVWRRAELMRGLQVLLTLGVVTATLGATVLRELRRVASVDITAFYPDHETAASVGGWWVFAFFLLLNTGLIYWVIRLARGAQLPKKPTDA